MSTPIYRVVRLSPHHDLTAFDCGDPEYNNWLSVHAIASVQAGVCAVYLLEEADEHDLRVVGYYAINPTQVIRDHVPPSLARGWTVAVPVWKLGKLALHNDLRANKSAQWGRHLLRDALETIISVPDAGGGKLIVVDAGDPALLSLYTANGFRTTGSDGDLSLYLKVSTARKVLRHRPIPVPRRRQRRHSTTSE